MNHLYLLITIIVVAASIAACARLVYANSWVAEPVGLIGALASFLLVFGSFASSWGKPQVDDIPAAQIERTAYRVVVTVPGGEATFTDARSVALVDQIASVRVKRQRNAWGITFESGSRAPQVALSFKDGSTASAALTAVTR